MSGTNAKKPPRRQPLKLQPVNANISVLLKTRLWARRLKRYEPLIDTACREALTHLKFKKNQREVAFTVVLSDDAFVQTLNHQFRGKNRPTNVLSFPADHMNDSDDSAYLGDIILSLTTIWNESKAQSKRFADHVVHLVVHGLLHLCGYDHESSADAREMEALEIRILSSLDIANPYIIPTA